MSKKNKKKLRKILRSQISANQSQTNTVATAQTETADMPVSVTQEESRVPIHDQSADEVKEVKHEIKKILLTVLSLVAIVVVLYIINIKTDIILKAGEWLAVKLNVNV